MKRLQGDDGSFSSGGGGIAGARLHLALPRWCDITGTQPARVVEGIHGGDEFD